MVRIATNTLCTTGGSDDSWTDDRITCTVREGAFDSGTNAWLYVTDGDGSWSDGFPMGAWGDGGDTDSPNGGGNPGRGNRP